MTRIEAILFDKDGVLVDFDKTWGRWGGGFLDRLAPQDADLRSELANALMFDDVASVFLPESPMIAGTSDTWLKLVGPLLDDLSEEEIYLAAGKSLEHTPIVATIELRPVLAELRGRGLRIGLATNDFENQGRKHMTELGVVDLFDLILGFDSGFGAKPEPGMQLAFAEHVDSKPEHVVMVGDSTHDLIAGAAAGMVSVGVLSGPASREQLEPYAHVVLNHIGELAGWLDEGYSKA